jgi:hypothetical protein
MRTGRHRLTDELRRLIESMAPSAAAAEGAMGHRAAVKIAAEQGRTSPSYTVVREVVA